MRILLSNDDGYRAPGLAVLAERLAALGDVVVVAPDRNRSGASNSLTLDRPLRLDQGDKGFHRVDGTPADCVHIALTGLLESMPDLVVSGINAGEDPGDDVLYSGTVAAAMEGCFMGCPALVVSLSGSALAHYSTAADVACTLVNEMMEHGRGKNWLISVNVRDRPRTELRGVRVIRLGQRPKGASVVRRNDPCGRPPYWIGPSAPPRTDRGTDTGFDAVTGFVSVTPLHADLTAPASLTDTASRAGR